MYFPLLSSGKMCFSFRRAYKSSVNPGKLCHCHQHSKVLGLSRALFCRSHALMLNGVEPVVATPESTKQLDQVSFLDLESLWHGIKEQIEC